MDHNAFGRNNSGLTLIEVVVSFVIVLFLALLLWPPGISVTHQRAVRIKCLNNIKQLDLGLIQYGCENDDRLPEVPVGSAHWAWDMPVALTSVIERQGVNQGEMYDPGFPQQDDDRLWNAAPDKYRVIGYALALGGPGSSVITSNQNSTINPEHIEPGDKTSPRPDASTRVLVADAVITPGAQNSTNEMASYSWSSIRSSLPIIHRSPHLDKNGKFPTGGNQAMLDGSGRWFKWQGMIPRTAGSADTATFWW